MNDQEAVHTSVNIVVHGQQYPISADGDEEYVRKVAAYVDERMS
jgi:cell division protein ZapA (FtsZ GTPase activity inhibitor)